jgi:FixJ family two-component response regulator
MHVARLIEDLPDADSDRGVMVLVVDDDLACLDEYSEMVTSLGYECLATCDPVLAIRHIAGNPQIAIVISDVQMPGMDGIALLQELSFRFFPKRPMAAIAITGEPSLEVAVSAMRSSAMDFLSKPVCRKDLAAALRRASAIVAIESDRRKLSALAEVVHQADDTIGSVDTQLVGPNNPGPEPTLVELRALVRSIIKGRRARFDFLDEELFSDPSWDILLELTAAALDGEAIPSSSACAAANAPMTTALRHITKLTESGLVTRWRDPNHKRRVLLKLTDQTFDSMKKYLIAHGRRRDALAADPR